MLHGVAERRNHAIVSAMKVSAWSSSTIVTRTTNEDIGFMSRQVRKTRKFQLKLASQSTPNSIGFLPK
jgi:hypothetical protein